MDVNYLATALPAVKTLAGSVDYTTTVEPFWPQLYALPTRLLESWSDPQALTEIYLSTNPFVSTVAFSLLLAPVFLIVSEINKNYSQVDRCWSLLPTVYNAHYTLYAHLAGLPTRRLDTLLVFSAIWSTRLTYNYWRRGGYNIGSEDYRWEVVKAYIGQPWFFLLNVTFIASIQSVLLMIITAPTYVIMLASTVTGNEDTMADLVFTRVLVGLVLFEYFADQQQWNFQEAKREYQKTAKVPVGYQAEDLDRGFVVTGLWSWSRHPNFAAEQAIWVTVYQYSCYVTESYWNWSGIGAVAYLALFQGSTWLTELLSARKYPEYAEYQQRVGRFLPRLSTDAPKEWSSHSTAQAKAKKADTSPK